MPSSEKILEDGFLYYTVASSEQHGAFFETTHLAFLIGNFQNEIFRNYCAILYTVYLSIPSCEQILGHRVLFSILTSTELQGEFLKTTNLAFLEIKKLKKKILRNHLHLVQVHLLRQQPHRCSSSIGGLALGAEL